MQKEWRWFYQRCTRISNRSWHGMTEICNFCVFKVLNSIFNYLFTTWLLYCIWYHILYSVFHRNNSCLYHIEIVHIFSPSHVNPEALWPNQPPALLDSRKRGELEDHNIIIDARGEQRAEIRFSETIWGSMERNPIPGNSSQSTKKVKVRDSKL